MSEADPEPGMFEGQFIIAMPRIGDDRFEKTLIYMCSHNDQGALGLVVNRLTDQIDFPELLDQLNIETSILIEDKPIHYGGPVETGRGFVLHSMDYTSEFSTMKTSPTVGLTATVDILKAIATNDGPRHSLLALGYAGWGPGQLDNEVRRNGWLHCAADEDLLFDDDNDTKWDRALAKLGVDARLLSSEAGLA